MEKNAALDPGDWTISKKANAADRKYNGLIMSILVVWSAASVRILLAHWNASFREMNYLHKLSYPVRKSLVPYMHLKVLSGGFFLSC